jgi:hypothetical protein
VPERRRALDPLPLQHDAPYGPAARPLDAGQRLHLPRAASAAVMHAACARECRGSNIFSWGMCVSGDHPLFAAALADDAEKPRRERTIIEASAHYVGSPSPLSAAVLRGLWTSGSLRSGLRKKSSMISLPNSKASPPV